MFLLLEVSDADRLTIIPDDVATASTVRIVGRGATLADIVNLVEDAEIAECKQRHLWEAKPDAGTLAATKLFVNPDNDEVDEDGDLVLEPTPLLTPVLAFVRK